MKTAGRFMTPLGPATAVLNEDGALCEFTFSSAYVGPGEATQDDQTLRGVARQVLEYFEGKRQIFELALAPAGTPFQQSVWNELVKIPFGQTISYATLAARVGRIKASRAVGQANGANPVALIIPCHRVISANGMLTGYSGGLPIKRALLDFERKIYGAAGPQLALALDG